jgi:hypothetical protein
VKQCWKKKKGESNGCRRTGDRFSEMWRGSEKAQTAAERRKSG